MDRARTAYVSRTRGSSRAAGRVTSAAMNYRTKRPRSRALLTFGVGATLAITQLGAGCVPPSRRRCATSEVDDAGNCVSVPDAAATDGGSDAK